MPYAADERVVFDARRWARLWGPYPDPAAAARATVGIARGQRFFDLALRDRAGRALKLSDLRGKVVVLHFWGSWCPPCRREMPDLQALARSLGGRQDIRLVLLQVREDFVTAGRWARQQGLALPLYDSGADGGARGALPLADGGAIKDRELARAFPSTYVLDRRGVVVFGHTGPLADWPAYRPFLLDLASSPR
ncbi:MAG: TlpA disulfide reductase family protein [Rhodocyclaceae bacterium]|nr:TlpA disulfide reductase family protein [Rhodocyclaceae bacterium]